MIVYWVLAIFAAFFLGVNNWLFWPMLVVFWAAVKMEDAPKAYWLAAGIGLLTDLLLGRLLGISAVFLLVGSGLIFGYRSRAQVPVLLLLGYFLVLSFLWRWLWG